MSRRMTQIGHVARMGEERNAQFWRPPGSHRRTWRDNIKIDLREMGWVLMDWIHLACYKNQWQGIVNTAMILWVLECLHEWHLYKKD
jgi:hypothetical protein